MRTLKEISDALRKAMITELQKVNDDVVDTELGLESPLALAHAPEIRSLELLAQEVANEYTPFLAQSRDVSSIGKLEEYGKLLSPPIIRDEAKQGVYMARFSATTGGTIPAETILKADNNVSAVLVNDLTLLENETKEALIITANAGASNNIPQDKFLTITRPVAGIKETATICKTLDTATDKEDLEIFRQKIIKAFSSKSSGGTKRDFRLWAVGIAGIKEVYPYSAVAAGDGKNVVNLGIGFPVVYIEWEGLEQRQKSIDEYIDVISQNATICGGQIQILECSRLYLTITLVNYTSTDAAILSLLKNQAQSLLSKIRPYISGLDENRNDEIIANEIFFVLRGEAGKYGASFSRIVVNNGKIDIENHTLNAGEIPILQDFLIG